MTDIPSYPLCRTPNCRTRPEPGYADRGLCQYHETAGVDAIQALPDDWSDLQRLIAQKPDLGMSASGPAPFGPTVPLDLHADALAREIVYTVLLWEEVVRDRAGLSDVASDPTPVFVQATRAAKTLAAHYSVLLALGPTDHESYERQETVADGVDAVVTLAALHRRARARIGVTSRVYALPGSCPDCGWEALRHRDGGDDVWCEHCRAVWPWDEYKDRVGLLVAGRAA